MRRKAPRVGDLVALRNGLETKPAAYQIGLVTDTVGIHLYLRLMKVPYEGHSGTEVVRRDSVDVVATAKHD